MLSGGILLICCSFWYHCGYGSIVYWHRGFLGSAASYAERSTLNKGESNSSPDVGEGVWVALFLLDANFFASFFMILLAEGLAPPVQANTIGLKLLFSTSRIRSSYFNFLIFSWYLYASLISLGQLFASGLKIFTSKNVHSNLCPQSSFALMSGRASSSEQVVLMSKVSSCSSWNMGSIWTSWQTSSIRLAKVSLISLWRIIVYPPLGQCKACANENFWEQGHFAGVFMGS